MADLTDRELLTLAAKAADLTIAWDARGAYIVEEGVSGASDVWNPLTDDGDALRLALALDMSIDIEEREDSTYAYAGPSPRAYAWEMWRNDKAGATRRAIVRAAAAIQLAKEGK